MSTQWNASFEQICALLEAIPKALARCEAYWHHPSARSDCQDWATCTIAGIPSCDEHEKHKGVAHCHRRPLPQAELVRVYRSLEPVR